MRGGAYRSRLICRIHLHVCFSDIKHPLLDGEGLEHDQPALLCIVPAPKNANDLVLAQVCVDVHRSQHYRVHLNRERLCVCPRVPSWPGIRFQLHHGVSEPRHTMRACWGPLTS